MQSHQPALRADPEEIFQGRDQPKGKECSTPTGCRVSQRQEPSLRSVDHGGSTPGPPAVQSRMLRTDGHIPELSNTDKEDTILDYLS